MGRVTNFFLNHGLALLFILVFAGIVTIVSVRLTEAAGNLTYRITDLSEGTVYNARYEREGTNGITFYLEDGTTVHLTNYKLETVWAK